MTLQQYCISLKDSYFEASKTNMYKVQFRKKVFKFLRKLKNKSMYPVSNKNIQKRYKIRSKFKIKVPVQYQFGVFIVKYQFLSVSNSMFLLITGNILCIVVFEFTQFILTCSL